ncbi:hypothetical protein [Sporosarcina sp. FSL K6-1508]|uniref:hypothetical protein n=1 Tax=Sporosarcina sp. FSL K6-1508 TaxID=2921553 RepID=UPI0030F693A3
MTEGLDIIHEEVWQKLKKQIKTDEKFKSELQYLYFYYERKLMGFAKTESALLLIREGLEDVVFSQYFQGHYVMKNLLVDKETILEEKVWKMGSGFARNEVPKFIKAAFSNEEFDWTYTEVGHHFGIDLLQIMDPAFDLFRQIRIDIANYGAYKAFVEDERYIGDVQEEPTEALLGNIFDLDFLSPQVYMQAQFITEQHELRDLFMWSAIQNDLMVGSVHLSIMPIEDQTLYVLEIQLANVITNDEKLEIANQLIMKLPKEIQGVLQTRLYHVENIEALVQSENAS